MKDTEWVPPNPSVDMMVEDLANLQRQLKNVAKNLTDLLVQTIIGCVDNAHTKYEADCLDWQSVINDGNELLCKADMLQFKELCNNIYMLCKDEYHVYKEWTQVTEARPRYVSIMYGRITNVDERAWNEDNNRFDDSSDNNHRQAFFIAHHQMLAHHQWLSYCPEEAALFSMLQGK
jgi:hypothetical protein